MIEHMVKEINTCLKNDLQIAALTMALTLPDTCGKAYHPQASVSNRYTSWYDDHVLAPKSELTGDASKGFGQRQCGLQAALCDAARIEPDSRWN